MREIIHLPGNSWLPFIASVFLAVLCLSLLNSSTGSRWARPATLVVLFRWSRENGAHPAAAPDAHTQPGEPPLHSRTFDGPGLWGMGVTLLANGALYLSLLFGWFYLWTVSPQWRVPESQLNGWLMFASAVLLSAGTLWLHRSDQAPAGRHAPRADGTAGVAGAAGTGAVGDAAVADAERGAGTYRNRT